LYEKVHELVWIKLNNYFILINNTKINAWNNYQIKTERTSVKKQWNYGATNGKHTFICGLLNGNVDYTVPKCQNKYWIGMDLKQATWKSWQLSICHVWLRSPEKTTFRVNTSLLGTSSVPSVCVKMWHHCLHVMVGWQWLSKGKTIGKVLITWHCGVFT
jgi:hypothetical protein